MANVSALLHSEFNFWWTGFYRVENLKFKIENSVDATNNSQPSNPNSQLVLGPFQGPIACTHIAYGRGVCGTAWKERRTVVVPDVEQFPGHIACSSQSRSEIVVPVFSGDEVIAVLDIDSQHLATFDDTDQRNLETLVKELMRSEE
jgi:GAF domain-containing protein